MEKKELTFTKMLNCHFNCVNAKNYDHKLVCL